MKSTAPSSQMDCQSESFYLQVHITTRWACSLNGITRHCSSSCTLVITRLNPTSSYRRCWRAILLDSKPSMDSHLTTEHSFWIIHVQTYEDQEQAAPDNFMQNRQSICCCKYSQTMDCIQCIFGVGTKENMIRMYKTFVLCFKPGPTCNIRQPRALAR